MPSSNTLKALFALIAGPAALTANAMLLAPAAPQAKPAAPKVADKTVTVEQAALFTRARDVLQHSCVSCHAGEKPAGELNLTTRAAFLKGGHAGPAVSLTKAETSLLLKAINYHGPKMPPQGKLPQPDIAALTAWVKAGLPWPAETPKIEAKAHDEAGVVTPEAMKFWSFQPVKRPAVPAVKNKAWVRSPIDAFVLAKLEKNGLAPNPTADKRALIRRATYDLTGLPPALEDVQAFLADNSPNAYEKVVDRLLASPQYGEKWGRHWLDLVRYAETNSYERDGHKPEAWRYRDYVIRSFNQDKPYTQFIREQLAGDEMPERTPDQMIATGYYRMGLWDDEPADPKQALYDDLDDIASTTSSVFLGMTLGCARCHAHKIDPIPHEDYYKFLAFFSGVRRYGERSHESVVAASLRSIAPEEEQARFRSEMDAHRAKLKEVGDQLALIEKKAEPDFSGVDKEEFRYEERRPGILKKSVGKALTQEEYDRYLTLRQERGRITRNAPRGLEMALVVTEVPKPRDTFVLLRGNPHSEGPKVEPGFPAVLNPPAPEIKPPARPGTSGRRTALAEWVTSEKNPLTSRVMANRVWHYHFGRGIARTTSDFGLQGSKPTHPELLDWLAAEFMAGGWKLKPLHKLIMTSSAYRMSSQPNPKSYAKDPDNDLFWRFDMRRLQAEEVRDSILAANGSLNLKAGGPSFYPDIPAEVLAGQSMPGHGWGKSSEEEKRRRSVYVYVKRSLPLPMIASFDGPETDFSCPVRFSTTQPTQALGMLNSVFINEEARVFADYLKKHAGNDAAAQVRLGLTRVLQREPTAKETERGLKLMADLRARFNAGPEEALKRFCVVALNLNEFLYLD